MSALEEEEVAVGTDILSLRCSGDIQEEMLSKPQKSESW